jgi:hypothetical protein
LECGDLSPLFVVWTTYTKAVTGPRTPKPFKVKPGMV